MGTIKIGGTLEKKYIIEVRNGREVLI